MSQKPPPQPGPRFYFLMLSFLKIFLPGGRAELASFMPVPTRSQPLVPAPPPSAVPGPAVGTSATCTTRRRDRRSQPHTNPAKEHNGCWRAASWGRMPSRASNSDARDPLASRHLRDLVFLAKQNCAPETVAAHSCLYTPAHQLGTLLTTRWVHASWTVKSRRRCDSCRRQLRPRLLCISLHGSCCMPAPAGHSHHVHTMPKQVITPAPAAAARRCARTCSAAHPPTAPPARSGGGDAQGRVRCATRLRARAALGQSRPAPLFPLLVHSAPKHTTDLKVPPSIHPPIHPPTHT